MISNKIKKIISTILATCMVSSVAYAADSSTMQQMDELQIQRAASTLLKEAKASGQQPEHTMRLYNDKGVEYSIDLYAIDTSDITTYAASQDLESITYIGSTDDMTLVSNPNVTMPRGDLEDTYWDRTGSVAFTATIYFKSSSNQDGNRTYLLTKVTGSADLNSSGIAISRQKVNYGCNSMVDGVSGQNLTSPKTPTGTSFSYTTGFSKYIQNITGSYLGMYWEGQLVRGTSIWTYEVSHNYFGTLPSF